MGAFFTALLLAVGVGTWIFTKLQQRTGYGNSRGALIGAGIAAFGVFLLVYLTARLFNL